MVHLPWSPPHACTPSIRPMGDTSFRPAPALPAAGPPTAPRPVGTPLDSLSKATFTYPRARLRRAGRPCHPDARRYEARQSAGQADCRSITSRPPRGSISPQPTRPHHGRPSTAEVPGGRPGASARFGSRERCTRRSDRIAAASASDESARAAAIRLTASLMKPSFRWAQRFTVSGSSFLPVGPIWMWVSICGHTPQSKHGVQRQSSTSVSSRASCQSSHSQSLSSPESR